MRYLAIVVLILLSSCAPDAKSDSAGSGAHAITVPSPEGSTCFAFVDGDGKYFGGSCK